MYKNKDKTMIEYSYTISGCNFTAFNQKRRNYYTQIKVIQAFVQKNILLGIKEIKLKNFSFGKDSLKV